jgi:hypothetical protein
MTKYVIKVTYLEGIHEGRSYLLDKDGYVRNQDNCYWEDETYTLRGCKIACSRKELINNNEALYEAEQRRKAIEQGKKVSKYPLYTICKFEPFAVELMD